MDGTPQFGGHCYNMTSLPSPTCDLMIWTQLWTARLGYLLCFSLPQFTSPDDKALFIFQKHSDPWMDGTLDSKSEVTCWAYCILIPFNLYRFLGKSYFIKSYWFFNYKGYRVIFIFELWNFNSLKSHSGDLWSSYYPVTQENWAIKKILP